MDPRVDNYSLWETYDKDAERKLAKLPICDCCGEATQTERVLLIMGYRICEDCVQENMMWVEDLIE